MTTAPAGPLGVLRRLNTSRADRSDRERCEMCGAEIASEHSHVVNVGTRALLCTCRACYLLFSSDDAALAYREVPDRYLSFPRFALSPGQWDDLQIPVGIAFMFHNSAMGRVVAFYPGPAGATESELPLEGWTAVPAANPELAVMRPDVEALLLRAQGTGVECFLVPIDACYQLVGTLRLQWHGFDGGAEVRQTLEEFFADLRRRSRPAPEVAR
ncbi:MAG: DUF5947 family protein [Actinomycetota bacterium]